MAFSENIKLVVDVVTGNATSSLSDLKSKVADTEGAFGKVKVAAGGIFDGIVNSPAALAGIGGAVAAFAAKSIGKFQETALAADKFRDSTGLSLDQSSRWIAVADDVNVSADTIQSAFQRMEKAIGTNRQAFGDMVKTAKDGSVDLSGTFLNVIEHLQGIKDPIERATEASKLFGKGFAGISDILGTSADKLRDKLAAVSDAQVINEAEVSKARDFQAAMDDLSDAAGDAERKLGAELIPTLTDLAKIASEVITITVDVKEKTGGGGMPWWQNLPDLVKTAWEGITTGKPPWELWGDSANKAAQDVGAATGVMAQEIGAALGPAGNSVGDFTRQVDTVTNAEDRAAQKVKDIQNAWDLLKGSLSVQDAQLSLEDSFARVGETATSAFDAVSSGADDAKAKVNDQQQAVVNLKQKIVDYGEKVLALPPEQVTTILAQIDAGDLAGAQAALDKAAKDRTAAFKAKEDTGATSAVERAFENAARTRVAAMNAQANAGGAEGTLNNTARSRAASIVASASTSAAENALNAVARTRSMILNIVPNLLGTIPGHAAGVTNSPGGLAIVGERGPELVALPRGADVYTASQTRSALSGASSLSGASVGSAARVTVNFNGAVIGPDKASIGRWIDEALAASRRRGNRAG